MVLDRNAYDVGQVLRAVVAEGLGSSIGNVRFHLENLFRGIEFTGKRVLDIGGGAGVYGFYASTLGATEVVCLEPELEGSKRNIHEKFARLQKRLRYTNVSLKKESFQEFQSNQPFDIVILYNSINHLDELACTNLLLDEEAHRAYEVMIDKLFETCAPNAYILVCDSSPINFWPKVGLPNPFGYLDWKTHQAPETWIRLFENAGFTAPKLWWRSLNPLRSLGRILFGNRFTAFFLTSHFCFTMRRL